MSGGGMIPQIITCKVLISLREAMVSYKVEFVPPFILKRNHDISVGCPE